MKIDCYFNFVKHHLWKSFSICVTKFYEIKIQTVLGQFFETLIWLLPNSGTVDNYIPFWLDRQFIKIFYKKSRLLCWLSYYLRFYKTWLWRDRRDGDKLRNYRSCYFSSSLSLTWSRLFPYQPNFVFGRSAYEDFDALDFGCCRPTNTFITRCWNKFH